MRISKTKISFIFILSIILTGFILLTANAAIEAGKIPSAGDLGLPDPPVTNTNGLLGIVKNILTWTYWLTLTASILFIIFAAFNYLTAAGDVEKVKKAHSMLIYAAIAIAITLIAIGAVSIIGDLIGNSGGDSGGTAPSGGGGWQFWIKGLFDTRTP